MQVDFYQLTRDPAAKLIPVLAQKTLDAGKRLLLVCKDDTQRSALSQALWTSKPESFLAHDDAANGNEDAQPILLSALATPLNGATFMAIADGEWRTPPSGTERVFYLFQPEHTDAARAAWRKLGEDENIDRKYWRQDGGRWVEGP